MDYISLESRLIRSIQRTFVREKVKDKSLSTEWSESVWIDYYYLLFIYIIL